MKLQDIDNKKNINISVIKNKPATPVIKNNIATHW